MQQTQSMHLACRRKVPHGPLFCTADLPLDAPCGIFHYARIDGADQELPPADERIIDVAVLDMNHGWPNLGHDSLVHLVEDASCDILGALRPNHLALRAISFDVRRTGRVPENPGGRFALYVGTGGPGHLDPRKNTGKTEYSQGITEDPKWQQPLFRLFDAITADSDTALLSVCHTFGVMCRWAKAATVHLRGPEKGGKSTGVLENILTPEARKHPWFGRFAARLPDGGRLRIMDNRLFDLIPNGSLPAGSIPIAYEALGVGGPRGDALTMLEWARDRGGVMPRIFGVNHHPEIVDRGRQLMILERKRKRREVTDKWYEERLDILTRSYPEEDSEERLALTSDFTIVAPLRFHLFREVRKRMESLGHKVSFHEDEIIDQPVSRSMSA